MKFKLVRESLITEEESVIPVNNLKDMIQHLQGGEDCFAIISAYQKDKTNEENSLLTHQLKELLEKRSTKVIPLTGEWDENIPEKSFFVLKPDSKSCEDFKIDMDEIARSYNQESYLFSLRGDILIHYTNGETDDIGDDLNVTNNYVGFKFE